MYELFCLPFYLMFGVSAQTAVYANFILLLMLMFFVYKIGAMIKDRYLGLLACFQLLMYPAIFGFSRIYFTSLATTAFVAFGVYCILYSDYFKDTRRVILLSICGIILVKLKLEKSLAYLSVPAALYLFNSFKINKELASRRKFYRNLGIFSVSCAVLLALFTNTFSFISRINYYLIGVHGTTSSLRVNPPTLSMNTIMIYLKDLFFIQTGQLGFIFFAFGIFFFLKNRLRYKSILASWILAPYIFHTVYYFLSGIHASYYTIEYLPAIALVSSCGIYYALQKIHAALRMAVCLVYISLNLINYTAINYYNRQLPFFQTTKWVSFLGKIYLHSSPPEEEDYFKTTQKLIKNITTVKKQASIVLVNHYPSLRALKDKIILYNVIKKNSIDIYDFSVLLFNLEPPDSAEVLSRKIKEADLIINGNQFYPADMSSKLKHYKQFGTIYDFSRSVSLEEEKFNAARDDFELVEKIKNPKINISFFLNKSIKKKLDSLSLKDSNNNKAPAVIK